MAAGQAGTRGHVQSLAEEMELKPGQELVQTQHQHTEEQTVQGQGHTQDLVTMVFAPT